MLCGVVLSYQGPTPPGGSAPTPQVIAMITGLTGLGATRKTVDNVNNDVASGWIQVLFSCLAKLKPFQVRVVTNTNDATWIANMTGRPGVLTITWPFESGYSTGGSLAFTAGFSDTDFGSADIEGRVDGSFTLTPSGLPTVVAGTHP